MKLVTIIAAMLVASSAAAEPETIRYGDIECDGAVRYGKEVRECWSARTLAADLQAEVRGPQPIPRAWALCPVPERYAAHRALRDFSGE